MVPIYCINIWLVEVHATSHIQINDYLTRSIVWPRPTTVLFLEPRQPPCPAAEGLK